MKKRIVAALLVLAMVLTMIGCGNSGSTNNGGETGNNGTTAKTNFEVPEGGYDGSAVTIKFYHTMGLGELAYAA